MSRVLKVLPLLLGTVLQLIAEVPPFTINSVLSELARTYPEARRVDTRLIEGVNAFENLSYATPEGQSLCLDLYRPSSQAVLPAVLIVHGGGWVAGDRMMERAFAIHLASLGFVAVPVSYRLGPAGRFPAAVHDLKTAVCWLRAHAEQYHINPAKIGIIGASAGGTLAATVGASNGITALNGPLVSSKMNSSVQATVVIDGTVTFLDNELIHEAETVPSPYWEYVHGPYSSNRDTWIAASPIHYVSPNSAPTLFIKSTALQPRLAAREEMAARLRILGVDAEEQQFQNTPHTFWLVHPWFEDTVKTCASFLHRHLDTH